MVNMMVGNKQFHVRRVTLHAPHFPAIKQLWLLTITPEAQVIPRSVLMAYFEDAGPHLLCALGDGQLHNFRLDAATGAHAARMLT